MKTHYVAHGSVRGSCGHKHRSIATAQACCDRDQFDCRSLGGGHYSDRSVTPVENGHFRELTESEQEELYRIADRRA